MTKARDLSQVPNASLGFKNRIINGAMMIDQRNAGAVFTSTGLFYCLDRWLLQAVGATNTAQQVAGTGNNKAIRVTGNTGNTFTSISQKIEATNIADCAGQAVTFSFTLSGSAVGSVSIRFLYPTATDNYTGTTEPVGGTTVNFTTTPTQYTVTRTLDANANKGVWVVFDFGAVGSGVTRTIEQVQLEKGSTATSFDYRPYGTELALCQRYCVRFGGISSYDYVGFGVASGVSVAYPSGTLPVQMRTQPSVSSSGNWRLDDRVSTFFNVTGISVAGLFTGDKTFELQISVSSGLTAYRSYYFEANNDTAAKLIFNAEL